MLHLMNVYPVVSERQQSRPASSVNAFEAEHALVELTGGFERSYGQHEMIDPTDHGRTASGQLQSTQLDLNVFPWAEVRGPIEIPPPELTGIAIGRKNSYTLVPDPTPAGPAPTQEAGGVERAGARGELGWLRGGRGGAEGDVGRRVGKKSLKSCKTVSYR
jgi:hypothetical protein